jgi:hypothetical protein
LKYLRKAVEPIGTVCRRVLGLPSREEQALYGSRGCLLSACQFAVRNQVPGDYLEFGTWRGESFAMSYNYLTKARLEHIAWLGSRPTKDSPEFADWAGHPPRFFAFDSFEGLPANCEEGGGEEWVGGAYGCPEDQFRRNIAARGVPPEAAITVPGFYSRTLNETTKRRLGLKEAAIVHVDCDLYESTREVLDFVSDLLVQGSVLVFDDWFYNRGRRDQGERRACEEWLESHPGVELLPYRADVCAASFIVNFPTPAPDRAVHAAVAAKAR